MRRHGLLGLSLLLLSCAAPTLREPAPPKVEPAVSAKVEVISIPGGEDATVRGSQRALGALVLDNVPEVSSDVRQRLARYLETRSAPLGGLSDDGRSLLVTTRFADTAQVHWVRQPLGARSQLTFDVEPARSPSFVPSAKSVCFISDSGGNEQFQIYRLDLDSGSTTRLTDGKSRNPSFVFSWQGDRIAYASNARNGRDMDILLGDGKTAASGSMLLERRGAWAPLQWSKDGKKLLLMEYISINDSRLHLLDVASKSVTRLTPEAPTASYRAAELDASGKKLFVTTDRDGEFVELYEASVERPDAPWKPLSRKIPWNVEELALSPDGRTLAFSTNEDGLSVLHLLDTQRGTERAAKGIPQGIIRDLKFAHRANVLGFTLSSATTPGDAFTYDVQTSKLTRWTESEVGGLPRSRFVEPSLVRFKTFDGRSIPAFYFAPSGAGPHPVLVWIHGGPESQARPEFSSLMQYLVAESGIAVLVPNVRGSDGYGKSYLLLDNGEKREDSVRDIGALLDWAATRPELDAKRVAVIGGSYGGYMVLSSLFNYADRLVAGVDVVGISNFVTFLENTKEYRRDLRRAEYGDERKPKMREHLLRISPTTNASRIKSALFVAHGANDPRVPAPEAEQIVREVRKQGQDVWYMLAKNEGHGFSKKENRDMFALLSVMFLEKHLSVRR